MTTPLQQRLDELKQAFSQGQQTFNELKEKHTETHHTLLRLQGAIQVLEEMLAGSAPRAASRPKGAPKDSQPVLPHP